MSAAAVRVMSAPLVAESMRLPYRMAPVDTCGARGMDGQRFPFEKVRERDVRSAGGEMFVSTGQETRTTVGSCRPLMEVLFR